MERITTKRCVAQVAFAYLMYHKEWEAAARLADALLFSKSITLELDTMGFKIEEAFAWVLGREWVRGFFATTDRNNVVIHFDEPMRAAAGDFAEELSSKITTLTIWKNETADKI